MKVGIMTCHDVFNPGSSLQAYALSRYIGQQGAEVQIIDYKPDYMFRLLDFMTVESARWQKSFLHRWAYRIRVLPYKLSLLPRYCSYRTFNRKYLPLTKEQYRTNDDLKQLQGYDALICGSDQIWASVQNGCGEDPAFYLNFAPNAKKIAYAASFGAASISEKGAQCLAKYLPAFSAISVREKSGCQILKEYGFRAQQVLDPVFLMDRSFWESHCVAPGKKPENYVLVYGYDNSVNLEKVGAEYAKKRGLQLVSLGPGSKYNASGPENFLWLIRNAKMIITTSFHATAFSVIFETPFTAVPTGNQALFERVLSILQLLGLQGRLWDKDKNIDDLPVADYTRCREKLASAREDSSKFLIGALYGSEGK